MCDLCAIGSERSGRAQTGHYCALRNHWTSCETEAVVARERAATRRFAARSTRAFGQYKAGH